MIIYNKEGLDNLLLKEALQDKADEGLITPEEVIAVSAKYRSGFTTHRIFARIGFGLLTFIGVFFAVGLFILTFSDLLKFEVMYIPALIFGIGCYVILENLVRNSSYYKAGIDDMLLYCCTASMWVFINSLFRETGIGIHHAVQCLLIFAVCFYLTLRFADMLVSLATCAALLSFVFFAWQNLGTFGMATLPFVMMAASGMVYFIILKMAEQPDAKYYANCIVVAKVAILIAFYLGGNYFIVQKLGSQLNHLPDNAKIPFGFIFWIWTAVIPFTYIYVGLKKKDTILIRLGMLLSIATVLTVRYYHHILTTEVALILGGAILLAASYFIIRYLRTPKHGLTYLDTGKARLIDKLNIESLILSQTLGHTKPPEQKGDLFGGGSFGGGGSSSNY